MISQREGKRCREAERDGHRQGYTEKGNKKVVEMKKKKETERSRGKETERSRGKERE